jgi:pSer/pThr/pTyr-binding forkhead associated (FHA) protein
VLRPGPGGLEVEDLGSLNGTLVNAERLTAAKALAGGETAVPTSPAGS